MQLINCEISLDLAWSARCLIIDALIAGQQPAFTTSDTKLHFTVVTLSTQLM